MPRSYTDQAGVAANFEPPIVDAGVTIINLNNYNGNIDLRLDNATNGDAFMYSRVSAEGPFTANTLLTFAGAGLIDADGVCYDGDGDGNCEGTFNNDDDFVFGNIGGANLRFGRLRIDTEVSSEQIAMNVPLLAEYYNGTSYVLNPDDQCTGIARTELTLASPFQSAETDGDVQICEAGGTSTMTVTNDPFASGDGNLVFTPPGANCEGYTDILIDLSVLGLDHLKFDWDDEDGMNNGPYDDDPSGRATFGILSRPKEVIYTREPWN